MSYFRKGAPATEVRCSSCQSRNSRLAAWFEHSGNLSTGASIEFHRCRECGAGKIEREAHDYYSAFEDDDPCSNWDWYPMSPADAEALERFLLAHCPAPLDSACACAHHPHLAWEVRRLPFAPWPKTPGAPLVGSSYVHPTQVVIADGAVRLERACGDRHTGDLVV